MPKSICFNLPHFFSTIIFSKILKKLRTYTNAVKAKDLEKRVANIWNIEKDEMLKL
jgi:hypothetical protein